MMRLPLVLLTAMIVAACSIVHRPDQGAAERRFNSVAASPPLLRAFLYRMPKGGDLHNHLSGAAYAEGMIRAGASRETCFDPTTNTITAPPCGKDSKPLVDALKHAELNQALVDAWSMRDFVPVSGHSGHDHFFSAFKLFEHAATQAQMAIEVVDRAGQQRMRYIELMITFQGKGITELADDLNKQGIWTGDLAAFQTALMSAGLSEIVAKAKHDIDALERGIRSGQHCGSPQATPGCGVTIRWLQQVNRSGTPWRVFAQTVLGAQLSKADPRVAGIDYVAPEDHPQALANYSQQMRMLDFVYRGEPSTKISLHAGELTLGLVRPEDLLFHIRQAVELGHARRIGHGVDIMYELDPFTLLHEMARLRVAVEINLSSNAQILGVTGNAHPFPIYRAAGVPTVLSTDDEGIERVDRTHELQLAVTTYGLSWADLLGLERNTLEYAFIAGDSLWADPIQWRMNRACAGSEPSAEPSTTCAALLASSPKAQLQWALERDLVTFDHEAAGMTLTEQ